MQPDLRGIPPDCDICRLVYTSDSEPGISRVRRGTGFLYRKPDGTRVTDRKTLSRIRSLAIPPAWNQVWICCKPEGHLQATGRDARNRKQYRYHPEWIEFRSVTKFERMREFGERLVDLRARVQNDLRQRELKKRKVIAIAVALLDECHIRIGNETYCRQNHSFGLATLKKRHVQIERDHVHLRFRGKGGAMQEVDVQDPRLARLVKQCRDLPGQHLFQYCSEDTGCEMIASQDINEYILGVSESRFTAKDFRTWAGTVHAVAFFLNAGESPTKRERKQKVLEMLKSVAIALGNTPATCRKYYIHPSIVESYLEGDFFDIISRHRSRKTWRGLYPEEKAALKLLIHHAN